MEMKYEGEFMDYQIYRNSDGFLEAWRSKGSNIIRAKDGHILNASDLTRVVTRATKLKDLSLYLKKRPRLVKKYDPYKDVNQTKIV